MLRRPYEIRQNDDVRSYATSYQIETRERMEVSQVRAKPKQTSDALKGTGTRRLRTCTCRIQIEGADAFVLLDTGSMVTIVNAELLEFQHGITRPPGETTNVILKSASGHQIPVAFEVTLSFTFGKLTTKHPALVCRDIQQDAIIGFDYIQRHGVAIDAVRQYVQLPGSEQIPLENADQVVNECLSGWCVSRSSPGKHPRRHPRSSEKQGQRDQEEEEKERTAIKELKPHPTETSTPAPGAPTSAADPSEPPTDSSSDPRLGQQTSEQTGGEENQTHQQAGAPVSSTDSSEHEADSTSETSPARHSINIGAASPEERSQLLELVEEYSECFAWDGELGNCDLIQHRIELTTDEPVRRPAYRVAQVDRDTIEREVRDMLEKGVIEPSVSPYAAGVVLVPKKSGETRFCVDYRGLNKITKADNYPMPLTRSEIFNTLGEAKIFSCLDCQQGYWQVTIAEEDRHKTAFRCFLGLYQYIRMPFGLKTSPSTYQRLMSHILSGYTGKFCHCFIDDIICYSKTLEEHLEHLKLIFARLRDAGIKLKPSKCVLAKEKVKYLGHIISPGEIRPDPDNITKIRDLPAPNTVKQVRSFLGMASYYRTFLPDFSRRAQPLTELTKKRATFHWGQQEEEAFEDLKAALTQEPVLTLPDFTKPFILMTDGSSTGLGAILGQQFDREAKERVIAYASRRTTKLEENYSACELECVALVWAVQHFRDFILGRRVEVVTDHWALKWLQDLRNPNPRLQRWRMALQEYDINITHKPGNQHRNADFLSRIYEKDGPPEARREETHIKKGPEDDRNLVSTIEASTERSPHLQGGHHRAVSPGDGRRQLAYLQKRDPDCKELRRALDQGLEMPAWAKRHQFRVSEDDILERMNTERARDDPGQIVLPQRLVKAAVQDAHAGHLKTGKTLGNLRRSFFFKKMYTICSEFIKRCPTCQLKDRGRVVKAPLGDMPKPLGAWHTVAVDVLGPLPQTRSGKKYIIVVTDYLTRFVLAIATKDQTAQTTANALMEKFLEYGLPSRLITDNGPNFRSKLIEEMCRLLRTAHLFTTPYHPQFDGLCERFNRTLASMLRGFVATHQRDWDTYLPFVMHAYRAATQASTNETPFFLMFGRPCREPLNVWLSPSREDYPDPRAEVQATRSATVVKLHTAFKMVQEHLKRAHNQQKKNHDKSSKDRHFEVGDEVLLLDERVGEGQTKKLLAPWRPGYRVVERVGPLNYMIEHPNHRGRLLRVHVNRLKEQHAEFVWPNDPLPVFLKNPAEQAQTPQNHLETWLQGERRKYQARGEGLRVFSEASSETDDNSVAPPPPHGTPDPGRPLVHTQGAEPILRRSAEPSELQPTITWPALSPTTEPREETLAASEPARCTSTPPPLEGIVTTPEENRPEEEEDQWPTPSTSPADKRATEIPSEAGNSSGAQAEAAGSMPREDTPRDQTRRRTTAAGTELPSAVSAETSHEEHPPQAESASTRSDDPQEPLRRRRGRPRKTEGRQKPLLDVPIRRRSERLAQKKGSD